MTTIVTHSSDEPFLPRSRRLPGLSLRLILLTIAFIVVADLIIYVPVGTDFVKGWVNSRLTSGRMLVIALPEDDAAFSPDLRERLEDGVRSSGSLGVRGARTRWILADRGDEPPPTVREVDIRRPIWFRPILALFRTLFLPAAGRTRLIGPGPEGVDGLDWVEVILDERDLRVATLEFTRGFLLVCLIVSTIAAVFLHFTLHFVVVRPVRRLSHNIASFAGNPDDAARIMAPSGRSDVIGAAENALARMETVLAGELRQKRRLADLGLAVSKINHELRNILTTAQLLGDRLGELEDPAVRRIAPRLVATLNRAIDYCGATLSYGRASEPAPQRRRVPLRPIVIDQLDISALAGELPIAIRVAVADDLIVDADPEQLGRILLNLIRNAVEALAQAKTPAARLDITGERRGRTTEILVADNGPGIAPRLRPRLFSAFQASARSGGTGLGLPVADELVRLHGGSIRLTDSGALAGANFLVVIPDRP